MTFAWGVSSEETGLIGNMGLALESVKKFNEGVTS